MTVTTVLFFTLTINADSFISISESLEPFAAALPTASLSLEISSGLKEIPRVFILSIAWFENFIPSFAATEVAPCFAGPCNEPKLSKVSRKEGPTLPAGFLVPAGVEGIKLSKPVTFLRSTYFISFSSFDIIPRDNPTFSMMLLLATEGAGFAASLLPSVLVFSM
jgi:hypothetical protein